MPARALRLGLVLASAALAACLIEASPVSAHGDLHQRIAALTERIAREPTDPGLYVKRGELHRAHRDWPRALEDFARAAGLDPNLSIVDLHRGLTLLDADMPAPAKAALDRFLAGHPEDRQALVGRARALARLGDHLGAARDFTGAIARLPRPEYYLERAQALVAAGRDHLDEAIAGLDQGLAKLGPILTLQLYAVDLDLQQGRYEAALQRLDRMAGTTMRQEVWLARRAEILEQAGRPDEARSAVTAALAALAALPGHRQRTKATMDLERDLRAARERLRGGADQGPPEAGTAASRSFGGGMR